MACSPGRSPFRARPTSPGIAFWPTNGIHLPVLSAFELLGRLTGARIALTSNGARALDDILTNGVRGQPDVDGLATRDGAAIQVLLWNYHDDIVTVDDTPVHLSVSVPASFGSNVRVSHLRVDESHGDAYAVWVSEGMPATPSAVQIATLQQAMDPAPLVPDTTLAVAADGSVDVAFNLPRFGVSLLTILPAAGANDAGASTNGGGGSPASGGHGGSSSPGQASGGCGCRVSGHHGSAANAAALLGLGVLILVMVARHRTVRSARRPRKAAAHLGL